MDLSKVFDCFLQDTILGKIWAKLQSWAKYLEQNGEIQ